MGKTDDARLGARIRKIRKRSGLSRTDIAESTGISHRQIQKYETGINRISAIHLFRIARALEAPIESFFEDEDAKL